MNENLSTTTTIVHFIDIFILNYIFFYTISSLNVRKFKLKFD
jgi:hypothetical protein